jgi:hypothetical protein
MSIEKRAQQRGSRRASEMREWLSEDTNGFHCVCWRCGVGGM